MEHEYKTGDYFKCEYTEEYAETLFEYRHCFEGLVGTIVQDDNVTFYDTFWDIYKRDHHAKIFTPDDIGTKIKLTFIANIEDLEKGNGGDQEYYDPSDLVRLHEQHGCTRSCIHHYRKKGAKRSAAIMEQSIRYKLEKIDRDIEQLKYEQNRLNIQLSNMKSENIEEIWL